MYIGAPTYRKYQSHASNKKTDLGYRPMKI